MSNKNKIRQMMNLNEESSIEDYFGLLGTSAKSVKIKEGINHLGDSWTYDDKIKAIIASRYLNSIGKGENALELAYALEENLPHNTENFVVPLYIKEALQWICE